MEIQNILLTVPAAFHQIVAQLRFPHLEMDGNPRYVLRKRVEL